MVTLGDLLLYRTHDERTTWGECVGKRRDPDAGTRIYEVYPLVPTTEEETYRYGDAWEVVLPDRVLHRVRNRGNYVEAWKRMGWIQTGDGETARFEPIRSTVAEPAYDSTVTDSSDESTDDSSSEDEASERALESDPDDSEDESWFVASDSTEYSASVSDADSDASADDSDDVRDAKRARLVLRHEADRAFREWTPRSPGEARFKSAIERIETRVRHERDERRRFGSKSRVGSEKKYRA